MSYNWQRTRCGIDYLFEDKIVRVRTTPQLLTTIKDGRKASADLARELKDLYAGRFGKPLDITEASLAAEIEIHARLDVFFRRILRLLKRLPLRPGQGFFRKMQAHTSVIDCGEKAVDSNRFAFDLCSFLYRR